MSGRLAGVGAAGAAAVGGALFAPVYTLPALLPALAVATLPVLVTDQIAYRRAGARAWRAPIALLAAVIGLAVVTLRGADAPLSAARTAITRGWQLVLASTWPVRPDPELLLWVPLLTLLAAVVAVELLRSGWTLAALVPGLAVGGLAQVFAAADGAAALAAGLAYALCAALLLLRPSRRTLLATAAAVLAALAAGAAAWAVRPAADDAVTLHREQPADPRPAGAANPLDQIADRLDDPATVVFRDRADAPVTHWPLVVLDRFDGEAWSSSARYRPLGLRAGVFQDQHTATVRLDAGSSGPWLPTPGHPVAVAGADALIDEGTGTVVADGSPTGYAVTWAEPQTTSARLVSAALVPGPESATPDGLPESIRRLAGTAVKGGTPTFRSALALERWLRQNYKVATGAGLPTGHGYAQLDYFLRTSKRGTSEQFATAYVVMARSLGIPARLVVGYRQPAKPGADGVYAVTGADAMAWPEVHVAGAGWVPLDPTAQAATATAGRDTVASALEQARKLPDPAAADGAGPTPDATATDQALTPPAATARRPAGLVAATAGLLALLLAWPVGVPLAKTLRGRRRRGGEPALAVAGACAEARDRLVDHGLDVPAGATMRELSEAAPVPDAGRQALARLAACADRALWSGGAAQADTATEAWRAVRSVRSALATGPLRRRARAAVTVRSLRRPR